MTVHLHHTCSGDGPPVVLLHGLFGSGNNLGALARALADRRRVYSVDLPNHGRSYWLEDATLATMASAVASWMKHQGLHCAQFVGHSLGGKIAMQLALAQPQLLSALVVADIAPVDYPPHHDAVFAALEAMAAAARCRPKAAQPTAARNNITRSDSLRRPWLMTPRAVAKATTPKAEATSRGGSGA